MNSITVHRSQKIGALLGGLLQGALTGAAHMGATSTEDVLFAAAGATVGALGGACLNRYKIRSPRTPANREAEKKHKFTAFCAVAGSIATNWVLYIQYPQVPQMTWHCLTCGTTFVILIVITTIFYLVDYCHYVSEHVFNHQRMGYGALVNAGGAAV